MKKHLLTTTAIALGVAAAPAAAQDWNLDWGGFYNTHIAYSDVSGTAVASTADFDGINIVGNGEIIFTPSVTLDNGLSFGVNVQLEAQNTSDIDESYVTISGDTLGKIIIGGENSAGYKSMVAAPSVGSFAINSASVSTVSPISHAFRTAAGSAYTEVAGNNDVQRISYFTPSFNGLTVGVSYAPDASTNASNSGGTNFNAEGELTDVFDLGLNYSQSMGGADITIGARWGTGSRSASAAVAATAGPDGIDGSTDDTAAVAAGDTPAGDPTTWGIGAQVGFGAFNVGGHYAENDADNATNAGNEEGWSLGATYDVAGPWAVGLTGFQGTTEAGANDEEYNAYKLAGSRSLGTGVSWDVYAIYAENKNVDGTANNDREATIIGTSINLSF